MAAEPKHAARDVRRELDPRDAADWLEWECLMAVCKSQTHVAIPVNELTRLAKLLRMAPPGAKRKTFRQQRMFRVLVEEARREKARLVADGQSATQADRAAAEAAAADAGMSPETVRRAMQNKKYPHR